MNKTIRRGGRDYKPGKPSDNYDQYYRHLIGKGMVACLSMSIGQRPHSGCFHCMNNPDFFKSGES